VYEMVYGGGQRELDLILAAEDFSVQILEKATGPIYGDGDGMTGYTMKRDTLDIKLVDPS
jgi:predicted lipoprotein with Yx(FWY)xxD motif